EAHVIRQHDKFDVAARILGTDGHRDVIEDHRDLRFEIAAPGLILQADRIARAEKVVRTALIHKGIGPEALWHTSSAGAAYQLDVIYIGRAIHPVISAG